MDSRTKRPREQGGTSDTIPPARLRHRERIAVDIAFPADADLARAAEGLSPAPPSLSEPLVTTPDTPAFLRRDVQRLLRFFRIPLGRRLPAALLPENVGRLASQLARGTWDPNFRILLQQIDQSPILDGNRVQLFFGAAGAFDAMRRAIEDARQEILVEFYLLADDAGKRLSELLIGARARGVTVRVLADASHARWPGTPFWEPLRTSGIEVRLFQPFFKSPWYRPPRDHRKILVVDRTVAFTGGRDSRLTPPPSGPTPALRDIYARVQGRTAVEMAAVFSDGWERARGKMLEFVPKVENGNGNDDGAAILVLDSPPWRQSFESASALTAIVEATRRSLWISNPRFAPKRFVVEALGRAAERGVDVRVLVPERPDAPLSRSASRASYADLLEKGVAIHEYPGSTLQAKLMIADDYVSVIGSTNLDFRYFRLNAECNLVVLEAATARTLCAAFERDLRDARRVTLESVRRRPILHQLGYGVARQLSTML